MVGPEAFTEVRYLAHRRMLDALPVIDNVSEEFERLFGRRTGGLVDGYRMEDAETVIFAMGSVLGTIKDTVDRLRDTGLRVGVLGLKCYRPFPFAAVKAALSCAKRVVVLERMISAGTGGALDLDVMRALQGTSVKQYSVIAGLGGRAVTMASLEAMIRRAHADDLGDEPYFMDLDVELVENQIAREAGSHASGPLAEALNRDVAERKLARGEEI